jgi:hypothetical protein
MESKEDCDIVFIRHAQAESNLETSKFVSKYNLQRDHGELAKNKEYCN